MKVLFIFSDPVYVLVVAQKEGLNFLLKFLHVEMVKLGHFKVFQHTLLVWGLVFMQSVSTSHEDRDN